jgi:diguanylate cyclase (GGDEF)-like protein
MKKLFKNLSRLPAAVIALIGVLMTCLTGSIDYATGYEISISIFYLLPVFFVSWFGKRSHAVIISFLSAAVWLWADLTSGHVYSHFAIPVWNSVMRLGFFLIGAFLLSRIKKLLEIERTSARVDPLTGVANSRAFRELAEREISRSVRFERPFTLAYIDIDDFKLVNDTLGHSHGDILLRSVARTIKDHTRSTDIVSRVGGDEFTIFFPETDEKDATKAINKVREKLLDLVKKQSWPVTFSIGAVTCYESCRLDELIKEADALMYFVKRRGKNGIESKTFKATS